MTIANTRNHTLSSQWTPANGIFGVIASPSTYCKSNIRFLNNFSVFCLISKIVKIFIFIIFHLYIEFESLRLK